MRYTVVASPLSEEKVTVHMFEGLFFCYLSENLDLEMDIAFLKYLRAELWNLLKLFKTHEIERGEEFYIGLIKKSNKQNNQNISSFINFQLFSYCMFQKKKLPFMCQFPACILSFQQLHLFNLEILNIKTTLSFGKMFLPRKNIII